MPMNAEDIPIEALRQAVALQYDGRGAPNVVAKGEGSEAEALIALAQEHGIPLCDNAALVDLLSRLELGENIPPALYTSVAHILAFAYRISEGAHTKI